MQSFTGNKMHHFVKSKFIQTDETKTIALIEVKPSTDPVWIKNNNIHEYYIARTASAIRLSGKESVEYIQSHCFVFASLCRQLSVTNPVTIYDL